MDKPFTIEEVRGVVFFCDPSKTSTPDGFFFLFYQSCWKFFCHDVMKLIHVFYYNILDDCKLNLALSVCCLKNKMLKLSHNLDPLI
jgi:hypothetical protein